MSDASGPAQHKNGGFKKHEGPDGRIILRMGNEWIGKHGEDLAEANQRENEGV